MLLILHGMPIPSGPLKPPSLAVELPVGPQPPDDKERAKGRGRWALCGD